MTPPQASEAAVDAHAMTAQAGAVANEEWRDVPGWVGLYQVSSAGNVRTLPRAAAVGSGGVRWTNRRVLSVSHDPKGFASVHFYREGERFKVKVARLVAEVFKGPVEGMAVVHLDGNRKNNTADNLLIVEPSAVHKFRVWHPAPPRTPEAERLRILRKKWNGMKDRCRNPNSKSYKDYGGRGISICERWLQSFDNFFADMGLPPHPDLSIDRINNDGNYEPGNCRWATREQQNNNQRKAAKTHCIRGHEFTPENTALSKDKKKRICRACQRMHELAYYYRARSPNRPPSPPYADELTQLIKERSNG